MNKYLHHAEGDKGEEEEEDMIPSDESEMIAVLHEIMEDGINYYSEMSLGGSHGQRQYFKGMINALNITLKEINQLGPAKGLMRIKNVHRKQVHDRIKHRKTENLPFDAGLLDGFDEAAHRIIEMTYPLYVGAGYSKGFQKEMMAEEEGDDDISMVCPATPKGKYRVRFHLAEGKYKRKFQIRTPHGLIKYYSPKDIQIIMRGAKLVSHSKTAKRIYEGANKTVCAWVECDEIEIKPSGTIDITSMSEIKYNPKIIPHWVEGDMTVDGKTYSKIYSDGKKMYNPNSESETFYAETLCPHCGDAEATKICEWCKDRECEECFQEHMIECNYCEGTGDIPRSWVSDSGDRWNPPTLDVTDWEPCEYCHEGQICENEGANIPDFSWERPEREYDAESDAYLAEWGAESNKMKAAIRRGVLAAIREEYATFESKADITATVNMILRELGQLEGDEKVEMIDVAAGPAIRIDPYDVVAAMAKAANQMDDLNKEGMVCWDLPDKFLNSATKRLGWGIQSVFGIHALSAKVDGKPTWRVSGYPQAIETWFMLYNSLRINLEKEMKGIKKAKAEQFYQAFTMHIRENDNVAKMIEGNADHKEKARELSKDCFPAPEVTKFIPVDKKIEERAKSASRKLEPFGAERNLDKIDYIRYAQRNPKVANRLDTDDVFVFFLGLTIGTIATFIGNIWSHKYIKQMESPLKKD